MSIFRCSHFFRNKTFPRPFLGKFVPRAVTHTGPLLQHDCAELTKDPVCVTACSVLIGFNYSHSSLAPLLRREPDDHCDRDGLEAHLYDFYVIKFGVNLISEYDFMIRPSFIRNHISSESIGALRDAQDHLS